MTEMTHLSALDGGFLHMETPETPMHVGSLNLFELPAGYHGNWFDDVKAHVAARLHLAPVFTRKLAPMPFDLGNPVWIEDDDVDIEYHVRHLILPQPATEQRLNALVARLHSSLLDRSRPLWEFYVIEGLGDGRAAFYLKVHHAAVDGKAGVAFANASFDFAPDAPAPRAPVRRKHSSYQLGMAEMLGAAISNQAQQVSRLAGLLPKAAGALAGAVGTRLKKARGAAAERSAAEDAAAAGEPAPGAKRKLLPLAPRTPFNATITNQRTFASATFTVQEVRQLAKANDATINDVCLWLCSTALRRYLQDARELPDASLVAAVPISLRVEGDASQNNQVTMSTVELHTQQADALARLAGIKAASRQMKRRIEGYRGLIPKDFPSLGVPWLMSGYASLYGRSHLAERLPPLANVVISNVPRPNTPLYLAGARMLSYLPVSVVAHGVALNMTIHGYHDKLHFGLLGCRRAVPDIDQLAALLPEALAELRAATPAPQAPATQVNGAAGAVTVPAKQAAAGKAVGKVARKAPRKAAPAPQAGRAARVKRTAAAAR